VNNGDCIVKISKLLKNIKIEKVPDNALDLDIEKIVFDTRENLEKSLFFCLKGSSTDGHDYLVQAEKFGAVAAVVERFVKGVKIPQILVQSARKTLTLACSNFYNNPEKDLKLVALVGTNGKTSTAQILKHIFLKAGKKAGVIGTLGYFVNEEQHELNLTTPDPNKLFEVFSIFKQNNIEYVFMEVSAHAIWLDKVYGLNFDVAALTNISQDHLDFFHTMENYSNTKINFLKSNQVDLLVVNADDSSYDKFFDDEVVTYGIKSPSDNFALDIVLGLGETNYALNLLDNIMLIKTKLSGMFNVYNALCAGTISLLMGISTKFVKQGLESIPDINGRFNVINTKLGKIVLDFAHTPDGLENILKAVKVGSGFKDIICLFGANGNKDSSKRKFMGRISEKYSSMVILTSDDPKYENFDLICDDIMLQVEDKTKFFRIEDRKDAIKNALAQLDDEKIIVLCGKAGENYQNINGILVQHNEREVVEGILKELQIEIT
jgi:UDP-N-acetylmuramoyl-L-alanyl-D-glutamate--2,6-diaminopimelate ligase